MLAMKTTLARQRRYFIFIIKEIYICDFHHHHFNPRMLNIICDVVEMTLWWKFTKVNRANNWRNASICCLFFFLCETTLCFFWITGNMNYITHRGSLISADAFLIWETFRACFDMLRSSEIVPYIVSQKGLSISTAPLSGDLVKGCQYP